MQQSDKTFYFFFLVMVVAVNCCLKKGMAND